MVDPLEPLRRDAERISRALGIGNPMARTKEVLKLEMRIPLELLWKDEKAHLDRLTEEIKVRGITEPITIRVRKDGSMIVWDGLHRLAVAQNLGLEEIPVIYEQMRQL